MGDGNMSSCDEMRKQLEQLREDLNVRSAIVSTPVAYEEKRDLADVRKKIARLKAKIKKLCEEVPTRRDPC